MWKLPFATPGNYNSLLKHFHSCGTVETPIFLKLHTRYKYCIEQTFPSTLGWILISLSLLNRYFLQEHFYWLQRCYLQYQVLRNSKKITLKLFSPLGFSWLLGRTEKGPRTVTPRTVSRAPSASAFANSESISVSKSLFFYYFSEVGMKVFTLA